MKLDKILKGIKIVSFSGDKKRLIKDIKFDSRNITEGSLFVAVRGYGTDGHDLY